MRKLVKAGLTVPMILVVALATFGVVMADDARNDLNDSTLGTRKADDGHRARPVDRSGPAADSSQEVAGATQSDETISATSRGSRSAASSTRRGRQAPRRTSANAVIDEESWWWWSGGDADEDEDEDEDDDENQSPSNP